MNTGQNLGPREAGELCFRGSGIMKGYYGNPQATAESFDSDGFLLTGDVGYYDEDGFFYIVDRVKELIKFKGYQVNVQDSYLIG
jgi:long-subunit acyl-CoA synthetase (AMP-forming)